MKLKLNSSTKEAFIAIISSLGINKVLAVFQIFLKTKAPIGMEEFAKLMNFSEEEARDLAENKGELNEKGELVGFLGLSVVPTNHQLILNGHTFYTWCAADTLIFPAILQLKAEVISSDPITNEEIKLRLENEYLTFVDPGQSMISWIEDVDDSDIRCSMCNRVHFFAKIENAKRWHLRNRDAQIYQVTDFFSANIMKLNSTTS